jgi:hypothetical protein
MYTQVYRRRAKTQVPAMAQVDKHLIQPSAQLSALDIIDAQMGDKLPQLARECYFAEASCQAEPS